MKIETYLDTQRSGDDQIETKDAFGRTTYRRMGQRKDGQTAGGIDGWMAGRTVGRREGGWKDRWTYAVRYGWSNGRTDGVAIGQLMNEARHRLMNRQTKIWSVGWANRQTDGRMDGYMV